MGKSVKTFEDLKARTIENEKGCWIWQMSKSNIGYGQIWFRGKHDKAHRAAFMLTKGDIPGNKEIDHICHQRDCVNPDHLRLVTHRENCAYRNKVQTHCKGGHEFSRENTFFTKRLTRICKTCRYQRVKLWRSRHPEKARWIWRQEKRRKVANALKVGLQNQENPLNVLDNSSAKFEEIRQ